jgi:hypothetical protein
MLLGGRLLCLSPGSGFRRGALLRLLCLSSGSRFRCGTLLRLLCLSPGSGFRCGTLLRLLMRGCFRRRFLLLGSGVGPLLRLLPGSGLGYGPSLGLLTENFLLLRPLLRQFLRCSRSAGGMRRRSRVRRGCSLAG